MDIKIIKDLVNSGYSTHSIAKKLEKSQTSIMYWIRKFGLKTEYTFRTNRSPNTCLNCKNITYNRLYCSKKCEGESKIKSSNLKIENGKKVIPGLLRRYIIEKNGWICSECFNTTWNDKPIPLVLDHIDGNSENNNIGNLRLLCCNCDAQTPTYKNKNKGYGRHERMKRYHEGKSY